MPKLFLTTEDDAVVPPHHTRDLYAKASMPKILEIVETGGHIRALNDENAKNTFLNFLQKNLCPQNNLPLKLQTCLIFRPF